MERTMRRFKQLLTEQSTKEIIINGSNGVLSLADPDGEPYGVPMSYAYDGDRRIYFHSATAGHKIDCIANDGRCSFCVVAQDQIVPEKFTTYFRSAIVRGSIKVLSDPDKVMQGLLLICEKYSPGIDPDAEITRHIGHVSVLCLEIDHMTGKEAIELVRNHP